MAPRRRMGNTRMDAALDAMAPLGFPRKLVRQTVDDLLKVYGGNEGWIFIEDSAYRTLIEKLLESPQETDGLIEDKPGDGPNEASASCSSRPLVPCSNTQTSDNAPLTNQAADTISASSETGKQLALEAVDTVSTPREAGAELLIKAADIPSVTGERGNQLSIKPVDSVSATTESGALVRIKATDIVSADNESDCQSALSSLMKSSQPVGKLCHKKRRPCYGWISDDDDEEEDLIELPAAPLSKVLVYMQANDGVN